MNLGLSEDSEIIKSTFERFFANEVTPARVRAAEPVGFDVDLWRKLVELGVPTMRLSAEAGGGGMSLFDTTLMMEQAGRRLAAAPIAESIVALRILGELGGAVAAEWIAKAGDGKTVIALALQQAQPGKTQLVPGGAVASAVLTFDGREVAIVVPDGPLPAPSNLGGSALGWFDPGRGKRAVVAANAQAGRVFAAGLEEWKLLMSAALIGLSREALEMAAAYAKERIQFGVPIGTHQGISHPLANDIIDADGGSLFLSWTLRAIADRHAEAGASVSMVWWWAARTATHSVAHALHTFGGYGLTNEYDIQLYHRRAKAWTLVLGDPTEELIRGGQRLFGGVETSLPDVGAIEFDYTTPVHAVTLADETRAFFERILTPQLRAKAHYSFEGHDWGVHRALGAAKLLYPDWPQKWGGRGADAEAAAASGLVWDEFGWTILPRAVTGMIARIVMLFAKPEVQEEVLPRMGAGEILASLGYTEPSCGSDVFAARTRAVRDGDDWVIDGQKMFTSGANLASYVLLLTRTDPDAPKHKGLTLFLVPLDTPGIEIRPVYTFMDERTNATFYTQVRISDRYRLGEVNGGVKVMSAALQLEQGGGTMYVHLREMVDLVVAWAPTARGNGRDLLNDRNALMRLARVAARARIGEGLAARVSWTRSEKLPDHAYGPASKVFSTEAYIADSADLLDLTAPDSLLRSRSGLGLIEEGYRHSTAMSIYGGTSEVLRSMIAERRLGLPRSRM
jgi:alkylation response protein AidB-like acyl-CoA dehydrogenase